MKLPQWQRRRLAAGLVGSLALVGVTAVLAPAASAEEAKTVPGKDKAETVLVVCPSEAANPVPSLPRVVAAPSDTPDKEVAAKQEGKRIDLDGSCVIFYGGDGKQKVSELDMKKTAPLDETKRGEVKAAAE